jgi:hypothetical protein
VGDGDVPDDDRRGHPDERDAEQLRLRRQLRRRDQEAGDYAGD